MAINETFARTTWDGNIKPEREGGRDPFVLLDGGLQSIGLQSSEIGLELNWRIGAAGKSFSDEFLTR